MDVLRAECGAACQAAAGCPVRLLKRVQEAREGGLTGRRRLTARPTSEPKIVWGGPPACGGRLARHFERQDGRTGRPPQAESLPHKRGERGLTLIELIVAFTIMLVLTTMAVPLARYKIRREREIALHEALTEIRKAIDKYKDMADNGKLPPPKMETFGYPETLDQLVDGVKLAGSVDTKVKFLRRIPKDPFTNSTDWGKRSMQDDPTSTSWGGQNLFDVYTKSTEKARDGTPYAEW